MSAGRTVRAGLVGCRLAVRELGVSAGESLAVVAVVAVPLTTVVCSVRNGTDLGAFWWAVAALVAVPVVIRAAVRTQAERWRHTGDLLQLNGATGVVGLGNRMVKALLLAGAGAVLAMAAGTALRRLLGVDRGEGGSGVVVAGDTWLVVLGLAAIGGVIGAAQSVPFHERLLDDLRLQLREEGVENRRQAWNRFRRVSRTVRAFQVLFVLWLSAVLVGVGWRAFLSTVLFFVAVGTLPSIGQLVLGKLPAAVERIGATLPVRLAAARLSGTRDAAGPLVTLMAAAVAGGLVLSSMAIAAGERDDAERAIAMARPFRSVPADVVVVRTLPSVSADVFAPPLPTDVADQLARALPGARRVDQQVLVGAKARSGLDLLSPLSGAPAIVVQGIPEASGLSGVGVRTAQPLGAQADLAPPAVATPELLTVLGLEGYAADVDAGRFLVLNPLAALAPDAGPTPPRAAGDRARVRIVAGVPLSPATAPPLPFEADGVVVTGDAVEVALPPVLVPPAAVAELEERFAVTTRPGPTVLRAAGPLDAAQRESLKTLTDRRNELLPSSIGFATFLAGPDGVGVALAAPTLDQGTDPVDALVRSGARNAAAPVSRDNLGAVLVIVTAGAALTVALALVLGAGQRRRQDDVLWTEGAPPSTRARIAAAEGLLLSLGGAVAGVAVAFGLLLLIQDPPWSATGLDPTSTTGSTISVGRLPLTIPWGPAGLLVVAAPAVIWAVTRVVVRPSRGATP